MGTSVSRLFGYKKVPRTFKPKWTSVSKSIQRWKGSSVDGQKTCNKKRNWEIPHEVNANEGDDSISTVLKDKQLREKIIFHVLFPKCYDDTPGSRSDAKTLRLVNHAWLRSVSSVFSQLGIPFISFRGDVFQENKIFFGYKSQPLELCTPPDFFNCLNNLEKLSSQDAPNIVKWSMHLSSNSKVPKSLPVSVLPRLYTLEISFTPEQCDDAKKNSKNILQFVQHVLSISKSLNVFGIRLIYPSWEPLQLLDSNFTSLKLPESLTSLELDNPLRPQQAVSFFKNNNFPKLTHLKLKLVRYDGDLFFKIISRVKNSLESLELHGRKDMSALLWFPVMPRLSNLVLIGGPWLWGPAKNSDTTERVLSSLKSLHFQNMSCGNATIRWTNKSIQALRTDLCDSYFWRSSVGICVLHQNFPNVTHLQVKICGNTASKQVEYVWKNWTQLEVLTLEIYGKGYPMTIGPHFWDALITGLSFRKAKELRDDPLAIWGCCEYEQGNNEKKEILCNCGPSIRGLKRLRKFSLLNSGSLLEIGNVRLITHVSFELAFTQMPILEELKFTGKFQPCPVLMQLWEEKIHGKCLKMGK